MEAPQIYTGIYETLSEDAGYPCEARHLRRARPSMDSFLENRVIPLVSWGKREYNGRGNIKRGRPSGAGTTQRPCTSGLITQHSRIDCTTALLYPFLAGNARGFVVLR